MALSPTGSFSPRRRCENPRLSKFPNLFDLKLRETIANAFLTFNRNNLSSVICQFSVDRVSGLASQQVNLAILTLYPNRQPIPDADSCALGVVRTTQVVGNVARHIEHFAFH